MGALLASKLAPLLTSRESLGVLGSLSAPFASPEGHL